MYLGLDSFRALAFFAVFAFHCGLLPSGHLGVQAFFVLSGFLLTPVLVTMKEQLDHRRFFINFYGRRFLRIFPLYYLYTLAVMLICLIVVNTTNYSGIESIDRFLKQIPWILTYTYNFFSTTSFYEQTRLCSHFWSLAVEEQLYLIWPVLILVINKKNLRTFLLIIIAMDPILRLLVIITRADGNFTFLLQWMDSVVYALSFLHVDAFAIGGYFALYKKSDKTNLQTIGLLYFSILLGYWIQYVSTRHIDFLSFGYPFTGDTPILGYSIVNFVFAKMIIQIKNGKFFPLLMDNPLFNYIGKISYGLYIFHEPIILLVTSISSSLLRIQAALISILLTICISSIVYELYEKKFLKLKDKYFPKTLLT